ncbi:MAG: type I-E CRISPR-associated protein Cas7/Cse4/CasC [Syntrophobacteraceae bacterium]|jgi:CRISPR system Cascade subunit CasC|nr:type I-E CRISPR-associated protein Cas7/Cse4/CasC [Syntrophobacteraceae bacterium]
MSRFIQLHLLTSYPPSNLNRDDLGRPKTAVMGGKTRLRISSQSLKRAWRTSDLFMEALASHVGTRTKEVGIQVYKRLIERGVSERKAREWARQVAAVFGALKSASTDKPLQDLEVEQLVHFAPAEIQAIELLADKLAATGEAPSKDDLNLLTQKHTAVDIAMFGRMLANAPAYSMEAAVQVAHAVTVHEVAVEDDYFTAVDDLNRGEEDMGAGHIGETEFGAGVFYLYVCINHQLLEENLGGDTPLASKALGAMVEAAAKVAPTGKQNSFASRAYASYILAEKGDQQPRSLSVAFLKPVRGNDLLAEAITSFESTRRNMDAVYGSCAEAVKTLNAQLGEGSLEEIIRFVQE